jgi:hypothetical protein
LSSQRRTPVPYLSSPYRCRFGTVTVFEGSLCRVGNKDPRWAAAIKATFDFVGPFQQILTDVDGKYSAFDIAEKQDNGFLLVFKPPYQDAHNCARQVHAFLGELIERLQKIHAPSERSEQPSRRLNAPNSPYSTRATREWAKKDAVDHPFYART